MTGIKSVAYEKLVDAALILLIAGLGWTPFLLRALALPYVERPFLMISLVLGVFGLGLIYDAAENLLARGRGLYAAAIVCSLPASGMVITDPGSLAITALMIMTALTIWLASRARGEERPFFAVMLAVALLAGAYFYGFTTAIVLLASVFIITVQGKKDWLLRLMLLLVFAAGIIARHYLSLGVHTVASISAGKNLTIFASILPWLPWGAWLIPAFVRYKSFPIPKDTVEKKLPVFHLPVMALFIVAVLAAAFFADSSLSAAAAICTPLIALLAAEMAAREFVRPDGSGVPAYAFAGGLLVAMSLIATVSTMPHMAVNAPWIIAAVFVAAGLVWTYFYGAPRWGFLLLFSTGELFGIALSKREPFFPGDEIPASAAPWVLPSAAAMAVILWIVIQKATAKNRLAPPHQRVRDYQYGGENFKLFAVKPTTQVAMAERVGESYSFVIFGDVTGAESPLGSRRGGYFMFRAFVRALEHHPPAFAVSLGDLASQATLTAYRRLRKMLGKIPVPLAVTPGNHDLFAENDYDAAHFHALFGPDNSAFRLGPVQFVLLNNAWGSVGKTQWEWLQRTLTPAPFTLVFCHKPPFDARESAFYAMEDRKDAQRLHELFKARGVTAVFSGHIHSLLMEERDGVTYIVSGGGGSKLVSKSDQHHYLSLQVSPERIQIRVLPLSGSAAPLLELQLHPRT
jgi:hypothetical protein